MMSLPPTGVLLVSHVWSRNNKSELKVTDTRRLKNTTTRHRVLVTRGDPLGKRSHPG